MKTLFPNVVEHLRGIPRGGNPALASEVEHAIQILQGRPGIAEKYDKLLLKLDRALSGYEDYKTVLEKRIIESEFQFPMQKQHLKGKLKMCHRVIADLQWMRARNQDLVRLAERWNAK